MSVLLAEICTSLPMGSCHCISLWEAELGTWTNQYVRLEFVYLPLAGCCKILMPDKSEFLSSASLSFTLWHWAPGWSLGGRLLGVRVIVRNKVGTNVHFFRCVWNEQVQPHHQIKHGSRQIMLSAAALLAVISLLLIKHYFAVYCTFSEHNCCRVDLWSPANTHTAAANVNKKALHAS